MNLVSHERSCTVSVTKEMCNIYKYSPFNFLFVSGKKLKQFVHHVSLGKHLVIQKALHVRNMEMIYM
jgi:hypothetical protein